MGLSLLALLGLPLASSQPNRIVPGEGVFLWEMVGWVGALGIALPWLAAVGLAVRPTRGRSWAVLGFVVLILISVPWGLAAFCLAYVDLEQPYARGGIGAGTWVVLFLTGLCLVELRSRLSLSRRHIVSILALTLIAWATALSSGWLEPLALVREYASRSDQFLAAVLYHLTLVGAAVAISLVIGFSLALALRHSERLRTPVFGVLSVIQTIPSLALFGLLLAPLAWLSSRYEWLADLGVQGIGWAPALIALVGYSLLPMTRNAYVALEGVPAVVIESARGMGMGPGHIFFQVRLPLALPVLLEAIRITTIQAIGLAAVAALIGAGGLGTFIFQGLGQSAMDLIVLGALPILVMALIADAAFSALASHFRQGGRP